MTFGSTFGRTFSPSFQPKSQAAVDTSWWLAGGIAAANCIMAYQARGMPDKASTKVNLANPGTYNLTEVGTVEWDTVNGWKNTYYSGGNYFSCGTVNMPAGNSATAIALVDPPYAVNTGSWGNGSYYAFYHTTTKFRMRWRGNEPEVSGWRGVEAVYCYAGGKVYIDGVYKTGTTSNDTTGAVTIYMGANQSFSGGGLDSMKAFALYNIVLTAEQISTLTTAMNAL